MIQTFRFFKTLFVLSFKLGRNSFTRISFNKHYLPLEEIKDFNVKIDSNPFFNQPTKTNEKPKENSWQFKMSRINHYRRGNLLDYSYHQNCYKLIVIDLSK